MLYTVYIYIFVVTHEGICLVHFIPATPRE